MTGLLLRCPLPPPYVELPDCAPAEDAAVAEGLVDEVWRDPVEPVRAALVERYAAALRARRRLGTGVVALAQAQGPDGVSASTLAVQLVPSPHDDPEAAAAAVLAAVRARGGGGRAQVVAVPLGPAAVRLRERRVVVQDGGRPVEVPVGTLDAVVPVPGRRVAVLLSAFCPTVDDLPRHAALAGAVLAGTTVTPAGPGAGPEEDPRAAG